MDHLRNKHILLGVSGSIAAYKAPLIVRALRQRGAHVRVAMTPTSRNFVSPLVLGNLAGEAVAIDMFDQQIQHGGSWHIHWAHWADAMLVAPCSAHLLASLALGLCDSVVACLAVALPRAVPLVVAPAMDSTMWEHPTTQRNVEQLRRDGAIVIPPDEGELASGLWGVGRMPEPETLIAHVERVLGGPSTSNPASDAARVHTLAVESSRPLADAVEADRLTAEIELAKLKHRADVLYGKTVLITAGPTREAIDAVRFISNRSSGKMGYALAEAARDRGAHVVLVTGPTALPLPEGVEIVRVETANQMLEAVKRYDRRWDAAIAAAAVADYMPAETAVGKLKRNQLGERISIELVRTPDILAALRQAKREGAILVGFALESIEQLASGIEKLRMRGCDIAVLNAFDAPESGFEGDANTITVVTFTHNAPQQHQYEAAPKRVCAEYILNHVAALLEIREKQPDL
jgi:phosphopantothenoylcysteine decarboxylase/phosphopantothenate--cysteine ligase